MVEERSGEDFIFASQTTDSPLNFGKRKKFDREGEGGDSGTVDLLWWRGLLVVGYGIPQMPSL